MGEKRKILIIGGGGREHAIGWKIAQGTEKVDMYFAPGNGGTAKIGTNVSIKATDINALLGFAKKENIDLTLAIPDDPLALGIVDLFRENNLKIFGPTKRAAQLESSKAFAKRFMKKYNLPTAKFEVFTDFENALKYLDTQNWPIVIKASGLALGKGVIIAKNKDEAVKALDDILVKKVFGEAGSEVVIEEFLIGPEISTHAFSDGISYKIFPTSQDHKRAQENDEGLNTGGMGTISPLPFVTKEILEKIKREIIAPTLEAMKKEGISYEGVLYPGLILTKDGPKILEYNARFGDPETQTYMRLLDTDLLSIIDAIVDKKLKEVEINWKKIFACNIVLASGGYPGNYEKGKIISGIDEAEKIKNVIVFNAGTTHSTNSGQENDENNNLITNGGRVLGISATGETLEEALKTAYEAVSKISFEGMQFRRDIGKSALKMIK